MTIKIDSKEFESLAPHQLADALCVSRNTLLRWEKQGLTPPVERKGLRDERFYKEDDIIAVLKAMKKIQRGNPSHPHTLTLAYPHIAKLNLEDDEIKFENPDGTQIYLSEFTVKL